MKKALFCLLLAVFLPLLVYAQKKEMPSYSTFCIAPVIGTDIGGAVPIPFNAVGGSFNPYPKISVSLGARMYMNLRRKWNIGAELSYKTIAMDADARVTNQKFKGENMVQFFTGTSDICMRFTMLELPLYVKYMMGSRRQYGILLGAYGAYNFKSEFVTNARKGFIGGEANRMDSPLTSPMVMDFTSTLDTWDVGLLAGYEAQLFPRISLGLHLLCGFKDIFISGSDFFDYKMKHLRGSLTVSYDLVRLGGKKHFER